MKMFSPEQTGLCVINSKTPRCALLTPLTTGGENFLTLDSQTGPVRFGGLHWLPVSRTLLYVMRHLLMSTIWDVVILLIH
jgi:hypothetical protein